MKLYVKKSKTKKGVKETIWVDFTHNGQRYRKPLRLDYTPSNWKFAEKKLLPTLNYKISSGEFFKNKKKNIPTVDEFIEKSFELRKGNRCSSTIYAHRKNYIKYIQPTFGEKTLNEISG